MVGAVQAWRKQDPEKAKPVWAALAEANLSVEKGLLHLNDAAQPGEAYKSTLQACSTSSADKVQKANGYCFCNGFLFFSNLATYSFISEAESIVIFLSCNFARY